MCKRHYRHFTKMIFSRDTPCSIPFLSQYRKPYTSHNKHKEKLCAHSKENHTLAPALAQHDFCATIRKSHMAFCFWLFVFGFLFCIPPHKGKTIGPIVYRLGHQVFILKRGVRLPLGLPKKINQHISADLFYID